jgi:hypothetical protein
VIGRAQRTSAREAAHARGEATEASDVDIPVDFEGPTTFDAFMGLRAMLEDARGMDATKNFSEARTAHGQGARTLSRFLVGDLLHHLALEIALGDELLERCVLLASVLSCFISSAPMKPSRRRQTSIACSLRPCFFATSATGGWSAS